MPNENQKSETPFLLLRCEEKDNDQRTKTAGREKEEEIIAITGIYYYSR